MPETLAGPALARAIAAALAPLVATMRRRDTVDRLASRLAGPRVRRQPRPQGDRMGAAPVAYTDAPTVRSFLATERQRLSPLSLREAGKHLSMTTKRESR
jgi:hypothetical protein